MSNEIHLQILKETKQDLEKIGINSEIKIKYVSCYDCVHCCSDRYTFRGESFSACMVNGIVKINDEKANPNGMCDKYKPTIKNYFLDLIRKNPWLFINTLGLSISLIPTIIIVILMM